MNAKIILILALAAFIIMGIVGLSGNAKLDAALGEGATARGQGQQALMEAQAGAIDAESAAETELSAITNADQEKIYDLTRLKRAANQRTFNTLLLWSSGIGAAIALLGLGISFAGYSALMGLGVLPARALSAPQISRNGNVVGIWMPKLERGVVINSDAPGQMLDMNQQESRLLEGDPRSTIAAAQSRALANASNHQGRQRNGSGFYETLEMFQQKALTNKTEDKDEQD